MTKNPKKFARCYRCGKLVLAKYRLPVLESPKNAEVPPKVWFCKKHYEEIKRSK